MPQAHPTPIRGHASQNPKPTRLGPILDQSAHPSLPPMVQPSPAVCAKHLLCLGPAGVLFFLHGQLTLGKLGRVASVPWSTSVALGVQPQSQPVLYKKVQSYPPPSFEQPRTAAHVVRYPIVSSKLVLTFSHWLRVTKPQPPARPFF